MRYWWVNHKQTYAQEIGGGYIWSPKRRSDGRKNPFYDSMRRVLPGDVVFSYASARIQQFGIITRPAASCPKPPEFGATGTNWSDDGWMVPVEWHPALQPLRPKQILEDLTPQLPAKHSPINPKTGGGYQHVYLAAIPDGLAHTLLRNLGTSAEALLRLSRGTGDDDGAVRHVDDALESEVRNEEGLDETTRQAVVDARRGQGRFRSSLEAIEQRCRVSGVTDRRLLRASHIKPWRSCKSSAERLDGNNGLLLSPNIDHLFDRGYISFSDNGAILISPLIDAGQLELLGVTAVPPRNVGAFSARQATYLAFHRENVFLHGL